MLPSSQRSSSDLVSCSMLFKSLSLSQVIIPLLTFKLRSELISDLNLTLPNGIKTITVDIVFQIYNFKLAFE